MDSDPGSSLPPQISVIVAVYNYSAFLNSVFSSLLHQDVEVPFEVVLCDDGSSDDTPDVLRDWCRRYPEIDLRYIWQPDRGFRLSRSRNNALRCVQGKVVVFIDGDMWLAPYFLRDHWNAHVEHRRRLVCGTRSFLNVDWEYLAAQPDHLLRELLQNDTTECFQRPWLVTDRPWMACTGGNFSIPAERKIYFDEAFEGYGCEDRDYAYRLYEDGLAVHWLAHCGAFHCRTGNVAWNPFQHGDEQSLIRTLQCKLVLSRKHPYDVMAPSLELVRRFCLDPVTDSWRYHGSQNPLSSREILDQFAAWQSRRAAANRSLAQPSAHEALN